MGIKKNVIFNSILTISSYLFPLLTFPYVSRVLGVNNIGLCNFIDSIINYFILLSSFGIQTIGIREIAKNKFNPIDLRKTFSSLFFLCLISTLISVLILIISTITISKLRENWDFMLLGGIKLVFNLFLTEWFFSGLENFKYITIRSVVVKSIYVITVFVFIKEPGDCVLYYLLITSTVIINSIINLIYRKRFVSFCINEIDVKPVIKSYITVGIYSLLTATYTSLNVAILGFISGDTEVGYYSTATKIYSILFSLFSSFTAVMLPRISTLVTENKINDIKLLINKSYNALFLFCLPIIIIVTIFAPQVIRLIAGSDYDGSIIPMRIITPLILIIGIEQILVIQILMPLKKDKNILINSIIGATIGILLNIFLVKYYMSIGSSLAWVASELCVLISSQYFVKKAINIDFPYKLISKNIIFTLPLIAILFYIYHYIKCIDICKLTFAIVISFIYFSIGQIYILKNEMLIKITKQLYNKVHK